MAIKTISIDQLCIGLYVILDLGWFQHSFARNSFIIKSDEQIASIRNLGIKTIRIDTHLSKTQPLALEIPVPTEPEIPELSAEEQAIITLKKERVEKISKEQAAIAECEKQFQKSAESLKVILGHLFSRPKVAVKEAESLTQQMLDSMMVEKDIVIHLMNDKIVGEEAYYHALNVMVLAMTLAKELGWSSDDIKTMGIGCLFHDIGKIEIPDRIVNKKFELTKAEQNLLQQHCLYGVKLGEKMGLPQGALDIIMQHHEYADGSGYPAQLTAEHTSMFARLVCIINVYENHCNRPNPADSLTPYEALAFMFAHQSKLFDADLLAVFIRCMGVYPPGTLVKLSDDTVGMVISINPGKPLRPSVLIYDPGVPKNEAIILDLSQEDGLTIAANVKQSQLTPAMYAYLSPRKRMTYYFNRQDTASRKK